MRPGHGRGALCLAALLSLASSGCADECGWPGPGWLTYVSQYGGQSDVRVVKPDGTCDQAAARSGDDELSPSCALATGSFVYWRFRGGRGHVAVQDVRTGVEVLRDTGDLLVASPAVSPDGEWIAFEGTLPPAKSEIYVMPLRVGAPVAVAPSTSLDAGPAWSWDGSLLYFGSDRSGSYQIWRVRADGSGLEQVSSDATAALTCGAGACRILGRPAASPDGATIAFVRSTPDTRTRVIIRTLATGVERILADASDAEPAFDPSGAAIAVMNVSFGDPEVIVRDVASGLLLTRVTTSPGIDGAPSFAR